MNRAGMTAIAVVILGASPPAIAQDGDSDGIPDALEDALARKFFPNITNPRGFDWDQFHGGIACADGKIPFRVREYRNTTPSYSNLCRDYMQCLELQFALLYENDDGICGGPGHKGDSEYVAFLLQRYGWGTTGWKTGANYDWWGSAQYDPNSWAIVAVAYDNHGSRSISSGPARRSDIGLRNPIWMYAADTKHSSYLREYECDRAVPEPAFFWCHDRCNEWACGVPNFRVDQTLNRLANAGEPWAPLWDQGAWVRYPMGNAGGCPASGGPWGNGRYYVWSETEWFGHGGTAGHAIPLGLLFAGNEWAYYLHCCETASCYPFSGTNGYCNPPWGEVQEFNPGPCASSPPPGGGGCTTCK